MRLGGITRIEWQWSNSQQNTCNMSGRDSCCLLNFAARDHLSLSPSPSLPPSLPLPLCLSDSLPHPASRLERSFHAASLRYRHTEGWRKRARKFDPSEHYLIHPYTEHLFAIRSDRRSTALYRQARYSMSRRIIRCLPELHPSGLP